MENLAQRIAYLIARSGKSSLQVARESGLCSKTLYNIKANNVASGVALFKLSEYFNVSVDWLAKGVGQIDKNDNATKIAEPACADPADNARVRDVSNYGVEGIDTELLGSNEELIERLNKQISELKYMVESYKEVVDAQRKLIESLREK